MHNHLLLPLLIGLASIAGCKPPASSSQLASFRAPLSRIYIALATPATSVDGTTVVVLAAPESPTVDPSTIRFCLTTLDACRQTVATGATSAQVLSAQGASAVGATIFAAERAVTLSAGQSITVLAKDSAGQELYDSVSVTARGDLVPANPINPNVPTNPTQPSANDPGVQGIEKLNQMRAAQGLPPVVYDANLSRRCHEWSTEMANGRGLQHDQRVYGTAERENIAGGGATITVEQSFNMWHNSQGHANSMYDRPPFPTGAKAGYGQYQGYSCLRICPATPSATVCN